jgi:hypothetical protein
MISINSVSRILDLSDFVLNFQTSNFTLQAYNKLLAAKLSPEDNQLLQEYSYRLSKSVAGKNL